MEALRLEREIDLPREIVWEALVDPVLVEGWLHPSERLVTGTVPVVFAEPDTPELPAVLQVSSRAFGELRIELEARPGGTRGTRTRLVLEASDEWGRLADRSRLWSLRLDQLESVLRGHPVDWAHWSEAHRAEDATARLEAAHRGAR
ncbi:hypothetical protein [Protaetiibacter larvae]|uniref:SRPBCC domain-containing protein n=1 Tax=Protaetiibacter larvae TaxID=2592654 RepID=A0A5C1Y882_9MICO|nr:hypothetical protein [Protaetiibacter larvae]QEO10313.1 hypothetical protein FLP23_10020 [Protaetiibacter larvae]